MRLSLLLLLATLFSTPPHPAIALMETNPASTVRNAVSIIDQKYLHAASNPAWKQAKQALLTGRYQNTTDAYRALGEQLERVHDPGLYLVNSEEFRAREDELEAKHVGTGLASFAIDRDPSTGYALVVTALDDSPAARAGIRPRDVIVSIDGVSTRAMSHGQILDAFGVQAAKVKLEIQRGRRTQRVVLDPSPQPLDAVQSYRRKIHDKMIGYIRVLLFTPDAGLEVQSAVVELERKGVDGYVLDLRNNPGGSLSSAESAARAFTAGVLGTEVTGNGRPERLLTRGAPLTGKPVIVLINGGTASAAELLAGALRDLHRAVLVGSPSFGRGRTQAYIPLSDGYGVFVPNGELLTPNGRALKPDGILPDLKVAGDFLPAKRIATSHDAQFQRAIALLQHS
ncbi:MAG: PDZ domain-containing protein [Acidobacteriota bacterium]|nr:PDZ domain-containing protein [Acidobacteriota bacterium]